jgi:hypothetical protein
MVNIRNQNVGQKTWTEENLEDLGVDDKIILKGVLDSVGCVDWIKLANGKPLCTR